MEVTTADGKYELPFSWLYPFPRLPRDESVLPRRTLWYKWHVKIKTLALQSTHTTFALLLSTSDRYGHYSHLTARSLD